MHCPKCQAGMEKIRFESVEVDRCIACGGLWFDMLEAEDLKALAGSEAIDSGDPATGRRHDHMGNIRCPVCDAAMIRMVVMDQPHIWYESCPVCFGTYFDAGEFRDFKTESLLERIHDFMRGERRE